MVTFWATKEAHAASSEFARELTENVVEETGEQVVSVREHEVGHYTALPLPPHGLLVDPALGFRPSDIKRTAAGELRPNRPSVSEKDQRAA